MNDNQEKRLESMFRSIDNLVTALHSLGEQVDIISDRVSSLARRIEELEHVAR